MIGAFNFYETIQWSPCTIHRNRRESLGVQHSRFQQLCRFHFVQGRSDKVTFIDLILVRVFVDFLETKVCWNFNNGWTFLETAARQASSITFIVFCVSYTFCCKQRYRCTLGFWFNSWKASKFNSLTGRDQRTQQGMGIHGCIVSFSLIKWGAPGTWCHPQIEPKFSLHNRCKRAPVSSWRTCRNGYLCLH